MTVAELIAALSTLPQDARVVGEYRGYQGGDDIALIEAPRAVEVAWFSNWITREMGSPPFSCPVDEATSDIRQERPAETFVLLPCSGGDPDPQEA